jgi:hypothetical protein
MKLRSKYRKAENRVGACPALRKDRLIMGRPVQEDMSGGVAVRRRLVIEPVPKKPRTPLSWA